MQTEHTIHFMSDEYRLTGTLHLPGANRPGVVIGCHGLLANRHSPKQISLARACNAIGLAYFRFDHRGCGDSQGDFSSVTTLAARCRDLARCIEILEDHEAIGPVTCLFGSSFGGTVVLAHAASHPAPLLITYAAPVNSADIRHGNIRDDSGRPPDATLLTDALEFDITAALPSVTNILVAHSLGDETVPPGHADTIYASAGDPKKRVLFEGGDHRMSDPAHQRQFERHFLHWIQDQSG
jgi:alpha/beta superfamily hydrolase